MSPLGEVLLGIVMVVGLVGVIVPFLPGLLLIAVAAVVWASEVGGSAAWVVVALMVGLLATGTVAKYRIPGRDLAEHDTTTRTWVLGTVGAMVGFVVIPVVGLVAGFVVGVWLGKRLETGDRHAATAATTSLVRGIGRGIAIEFGAGFAAVVAWIVSVRYLLA